jgi:hypothetical protein
MSDTNPRRTLLDWPLAPICMALAFFLVSLLSAAISPFAVVRGVTIGLLLVVVITALVWWALRNVHAASLVAATAVLALIFPGQASQAGDIAERLSKGAPTAVVVALFVGFMGAATLLVWIVWQRWQRVDGLRSIARSVNGIALVVLILALANGALAGKLDQIALDARQGRSCVCPPPDQAAASVQPDVFLVLLDGYARADSLAQQFSFDNGPFLDDLRAREFDVAEDAQSDYLWTHSTLASMLNMRLVEEIPALDDVLAGREPQYPAVRNVINDNRVFQAFRGLGYDVVATATGYERTALRRADVFLDDGQMNEWEYSILRSTLVGAVLQVINPDFAAAQHRDRIRSEFEFLDELAAEDSARPMFALVHVPAPHLPAVFDREGNPRRVPMSSSFYADSAKERGEPAEEVAAAYRDQLAYLNTLVIQSLDELIRNRPDAVVIVMSDHGSAVHVDWDKPDRDALVDRTRVLFAARTPGFDAVFSHDHRLVNTFSDLLEALEDS